MAKRSDQELEQPALPTEDDDVYLHDVVVLGGCWKETQDSYHVNDILSIRFTADEVRIRNETRQWQEVASFPVDQLQALDVGGPGVTASGGGFIGGGFGIDGAALGMAAAGLLNVATTKYTTTTIIWLEAELGELVLLETEIDPFTLRLMLSPAIRRLTRRLEAAPDRRTLTTSL